MAYALADVTHLRRSTRCCRSGSRRPAARAGSRRSSRVLTDPATYRTDPDEAWTRIKTRSTAPRFVAALRELARLRETLAQTRNVPRGRILKDDALLELAANRPKNLEDLGKSRLLLREARRGEIADGILAAIAAAEAIPAAEVPPAPEQPQRKPGAEALADLLRVLLKARAEAEGVAQRLIASGADLDAIAAGDGAEAAGAARLAARGLRPRRAAPQARRDRALRRRRRGQGRAAGLRRETMPKKPRDFMQRFRGGTWALLGLLLVILIAIAIS